MLNRVLFFIAQQWWWFTVFLLVAITTLSLLPLPELPDVPGNDKTHHFVAYAALMFPAALRRPRYYWRLGAGFVLWSGCIELIQPFVNRYGEWLDLCANIAGLFLGWGLAVLCRRLFMTSE